MIFPHEFHSSTIEDIQWNPKTDSHFNLALASIETNMSMAIWQPMKKDLFESNVDNLALMDQVDSQLIE